MNHLLLIALQMAGALILDKFFGEFPRYHPLVGFGKVASFVEEKCNLVPHSKNRIIGCIACLLLVLPVPLLFFTLNQHSVTFWLLETFVLYLAIGQRSLTQHAEQILHPLQQHDLATARHFTGYLVSRDTQNMSQQDMTRATVESVLENGHDAVIASLFYFLLGGAPLVILHRLVNTLDAMWGYKTQRFLQFGWCAARLDDLLGFLSAWATCLTYGLQAKPLYRLTKILPRAWRQSQQYKSQNGGLCMSVGAQVLEFSIGGLASYHGELVAGSSLGLGRKVQVSDIYASTQLVKKASWWWIILVLSVGFLWLIF
ncbi:adenosylcobinamide-phosphate synthase CbiB [uncultured Paraglaciecola sp.]|uniref:adenosylcobinamide-phosphate synthase CbiB n=1 Tax=uncultured Paraglaciecola sp. TaxID=1765024 RepID=UPI0030D8542C|tara:strand:- start:26911 stop:27852 length:942 start_codon:yes stop_codon:yes gene_type:complete